MVRVKVCGVTSLDDARVCVEAGVDAIGLNFWPSSVRRCDERIARAIVDAFGAGTLMVGVFVDESEAEIYASAPRSVSPACSCTATSPRSWSRASCRTPTRRCVFAMHPSPSACAPFPASTCCSTPT